MTQAMVSSIIKESGVDFGTSGARGLATQFTSEVCSAYIAAFIAVMKQSFEFDRIAVGIDLRPSSPTIALNCISAIEKIGIKVDYCGVLPTPALAIFSMRRNIPAIMITGSHIPFDRNGLKFYRPDGEISKKDECRIIASTCSTVTTSNLPKLPQVNELAGALYKERYFNFFEKNFLVGYRIGFYEHSSASRTLLFEILEGLGAEVISLGRTNEFVPIDTEAVSEIDKRKGVKWASEYSLDCIISTDGDGDRPLVSNENGEWLQGDILGLLSAKYLSIDALAVPVSCNSSIEESDEFVAVVRTKIGSPYVIEAMEHLANFNSVAGFEANGGFLTAKDIIKDNKKLTALPTRDAVLPALSILAASIKQKKSLSELVAALPQRFTSSDRIKDFPTEKSSSLLDKIKANPELLLSITGLCGQKVDSVIDTDGLRINLTNKQVIHLRPSGNAPELRCYCEAESRNAASMLVKTVLESLYAT